MRIKVFFVSIFIAVFNVSGVGQNRAVSYEHVREADIMWSKKVYRIIDLREKINLPFFFPLEGNATHKSLFDALKEGLFSGKIIAKQNDAMEWDLEKMDSLYCRNLLIHSDTVTVYEVNEQGEEYTYKKWVADTVSSEEILQYWVGEIWYFDSKRSCLDFRILEICPVKYHADKEAFQPLFWVDYLEARDWLDNFKAISPYNVAQERSFDELFTKHLFIGPIKKESNIYGREISEYLSGIDGLLEGEKIKERIYNYESDRWEH